MTMINRDAYVEKERKIRILKRVLRWMPYPGDLPEGDMKKLYKDREDLIGIIRDLEFERGSTERELLEALVKGTHILVELK